MVEATRISKLKSKECGVNRVLFPFLIVEGVDWIPSHDLSGFEEDNMMY